MAVLTAEARITARDATGGVFQAVAAKMKGVQSVAENVNSRIASSALALGARVAALAAPAAMVAGAIENTKAFAELERKMSRVGITADASIEATKEATAQVQKLAHDTAVPVDQVREGLDALVTQGKSLPTAMAYLPSVVQTAQAAGAEVKDIATTAGAIGDQMGITADKMQSAFDILNAAGKAGKFELKDMARYLPALAPLAASVGMKGEEGLRKLAATAQVVRNQTGTAEEAASSLQNIFAKMESQETVKKFSKFGIDLRAEMEKARKGGKDLLETFVQLSDKAIKGDISKVPQLFTDMEFARGMRALLSQKGAVDQLANSLRNVDGSTIRDLQRILGDTKSSIDKVAISWERLKTTMGGKLAPYAQPLLDNIDRSLNPEKPNGAVLFPNAAQPGAAAPAAGTRAEALRMEREERFGAPRGRMAGFADARAAERAVPYEQADLTGFRLAMAQRDAARSKDGGMTPGMMIERENEIDDKIREMRERVDDLVRRRKMAEGAAIDLVDKTFGGTSLAEEKLRLEATRNGTSAPTAEAAAAEFRRVLEGAKPPPVDVNAKVDVKVEAGDGLIATVVRKVVDVIGGGNGPGSTGRSMPETSAPAATGAVRHGRGDM